MLDDKFDRNSPPPTPALIAEKGAVALFHPWHAAQRADHPRAGRAQVPLVGPPPAPCCCMSRSAVSSTCGPPTSAKRKGGRPARLHRHHQHRRAASTDDTFGSDALVGVKAGFDAAKLKPVFLGKYDRSNPTLPSFLSMYPPPRRR